jgi:hypothetical protein|tara:strand:- start:665 stop:916 length:252 start_codon:yes stop_codon:yes gene_type:complete
MTTGEFGIISGGAMCETIEIAITGASSDSNGIGEIISQEARSCSTGVGIVKIARVEPDGNEDNPMMTAMVNNILVANTSCTVR